MAREHVYGPYRHGKRWRLEIAVSEGGGRQKQYESFATESEALEFRRAIEREIHDASDAQSLVDQALYFQERAEWYFAEAERHSGRGMTVRAALDQYLAYQRDVKGNRPGTVTTAGYQVRGLLRTWTRR